MLLAGAGALLWFNLSRENQSIPGPEQKADFRPPAPAIPLSPPNLAADTAPAAPSPTGRAGLDSTARVQALTAGLKNGAKGAPAEQIELARQRSEELLRLMETDPEQALAASLSFADYAALPTELRPHVERPFSLRGDLHVYPVCATGEAGHDGPPEPMARRASWRVQAEGEAKEWPAFPTGGRAGISSKKGVALQGFELQGQAVLRSEVLQVLDAVNASAARDSFGMTVANPDPARDFLTGQLITGEPVTAAAGGRLFLFADSANADKLNEELARMEQKPGPLTGSQVLLKTAAFNPAAAESGFDLEAAWAGVEIAASTWTETPKQFYAIRVDFPNLQGESISQPTLMTVLNTVSNQVRVMSYGKTWLEPAVSPMVVRLPQGTNYYLPANESQLLADAKTAFNALGTGVNLADYDIVCVVFDNIGYPYWGLAGGDRMWLQIGYTPTLITHEIGHNYGLSHARFWATSNGSVVGAGTSDEYGDYFDVMGGGPIPAGHYHMQGKSYLNWLTTSQWTSVSTPGTYRVHRLDDPATSPTSSRGLRITKVNSPREYYWAGYRRAFGNNPHLDNGMYLLWQRPSDVTGNSAHLIDTTPGSAGGRNDAAVSIGRTYSDTAANLHLTPLANGGTGADEWLDIAVNIGPFPGNRAPSVALSGPATVTARSSVTYTVTGSDPDGDALAYSWDFGDGVPEPNVSPITRSWATGGSYLVKVIVSDMKGLVVTQSMNVTVQDPLLQWTARASGMTGGLDDVCAGTNNAGVPIVLVVGQYNTVGYSTNGSNWSTFTIQPGRLNLLLKGLVYDGGKFIACGRDYSPSPTNDGVGVIFTSTNGTNWTRRYSGGGNTELEAVASSGPTAVAVGEAGVLLYSTDGGINWTRATSSATTNFTGVAWSGSRFVAVGGDNYAGVNVQVFTSANGVQWTDTSEESGLEEWQTPSKIRLLKDRLVMGGNAFGLRYSLDHGASFQSTEGTSGRSMAGLAYGNGMYFAPRISGSNYVSTDGVNWSVLATVVPQDWRRAAAFFRNTFITVGDAGAIWQSAPFAAPVSPVTYVVGTSSSPANGGTTSGGGTFNSGASVTVTATANVGFSFANWTQNGAVVSSSASYNFTAVANRTLVANFISSPVTYVIGTSSSPANGGTTSGGGTYNSGASVTVTATANAGFGFANWTQNGAVVSSAASYNFTATANRTLVANFTNLPVTYVISTSSSPANGGTTTGGGTFHSGASVTVTATANAGFGFANWTQSGSVMSSSASYNFTATGNRTLVANFTNLPVTYVISTSSSPANGGTTTGGGTYNSGASVTVTATTNTGFGFANWTQNGAVVSSAASYTFTATANRTLVANFTNRPVTYLISASSSPANGGTTSGGGTFNSGASVTVTATANAGFGFANWTQGGAVVSSAASYNFTATANRALVANFTNVSVATYVISTSAGTTSGQQFPTEGGSTTGAGSYTDGQSVTVTAAAYPGFNFNKWTQNGVVVSISPSYTFTVTSNRTLVAWFDGYPVNFTSRPQAWPIADVSSASGSGGLAYTNSLSPAQRTAATNQGWRFTIVSRLVNGSASGSAPAHFMVYGHGDRRFYVAWDTDVTGRLKATLGGGGTISLTTSGQDTTSYHTHELAYDPATRLATYYFNGAAVSTWAGLAEPFQNGYAQWGTASSTGTGRMNYHRVTFAIGGTGIVNRYYAGFSDVNYVYEDHPQDHGWGRIAPTVAGAVVEGGLLVDTVNAPGADIYHMTVLDDPTLVGFYPVDEDFNGILTDRRPPDRIAFLTTNALIVNGAGTVGRHSLQDGMASLPLFTHEYLFSNGVGTVEAVLYQTGATNYNPCFFSSRNVGVGQSRYSLHGDMQGNNLHCWNGTNVVTFPTPMNMIGQQVHVAFVFNDGTVTAYFDGISLGTAEFALGSYYQPTQIGASNPDHAETWVGRIDEVAIYASAQSAGAVAARAALIAPPRIEVTNAGDAGPGSLRAAIALVAPGGTITFSPDVIGTIFLTSGQLVINKDMTIQGPAANALFVSGNNQSRVFWVNPNVTCLIHDLSIIQGHTGFDAEHYGGGIYNRGSLTVIRCNVIGNTAAGGGGGGIYNYLGTLNVLSSTVSDNYADTGGGGVYNTFGTVTVENSTVSDNRATNGGGGGGIYSLGVRLTVQSSTLSGNLARQGGGIYSRHDGGSLQTIVVNSTISGNSTDLGGGGIYNGRGGIELRHCTITDNTAPTGLGGGVASLADVLTETLVQSSIIAGNTNSDVDLVGGTGHNSFTSDGFNLIGTGEALAAFNEPGDLTNGLPRLGALAFNGGSTRTHALLSGSPAVNAGDILPFGSLAWDQRGPGFPRRVGTSVDIGAFESSVVPTTTTIVSSDANSVVGQPVTFTATVTAQIASAGTPAGTVSFHLGNELGPVLGLLGTAPLNANGQATLTIANLALAEGSAFHRVFAVYSENPPHGSSTSSPVQQTVNPADTTTTLAADTGPGQPITLTATVRAQAPSTGQPTGTVRFLEGATVLGTATIDGAGHASLLLSASALTPGTHTLMATNLGGGGYRSSFGTLTFTVACPDSIMVANANNSGPGSLRQAILDLCAGGTITFAPALHGQTIVLTSGQLVIRTNITILGLGATNLAISGNASSRVFLITNGVTCTLVGLTITNGNGVGTILPGQGGGILNQGTLTVSNCTLSGNSAITYGGAINNNGNGILTVQNSTLSGNSAGQAGGGINSATDSAFTRKTTVVNSTLTGNSAPTGGGVNNNNGRTELRHCTLTGNTAPAGEGAGVASYGDNATETIVQHSIIAGNSSSDVDVVFGALNSFTSAGYNLLGTGDALADFNQPGDLTNQVPLLAPLALNGGLTRTHALLPGSPAIDAGAGSLPNAWQITDDSPVSGSLNFSNTLSAAQKFAATNSGWHFTVVSRLVEGSSGVSPAQFMTYGHGNRRFIVGWDLDGIGRLTARCYGANGNFTGIATNLTAAGEGTNAYHRHELDYDPATQTATYLVDGATVFTWAGLVPNADYNGQALFGAGAGGGQGRMNYHHVRFAINGQGTATEYFAGYEGSPVLAPNPISQGWTRTWSVPTNTDVTNAPVSPDIVGLVPDLLAYDQRGPGFPRRIGSAMDIGAFEFQASNAVLSFIPSEKVSAGLRLRLKGAPHEVLTLQWNTQPGPGGWQPLFSGATDATGLLEYTDTGVAGPSQRFYRALRP